MNALDRKLVRDLWRLRGQVFAVILVVACGIAAFVTNRSAYWSLRISQNTYYERYRFADVFAHLTRAPDTLAARIAEIPGVASAATRVVVDVTLDVPGLEEPAVGRLISIPEHRTAMLNDLHLRRGRYIDPDADDEVLASEAFTRANALELGDTVGAVINGRWQRLRIVGIALSPEYVYQLGGVGAVFPDNRRFGVMWMGRRALGTAFDMDGAFNDVALDLLPGANQEDVIDRLDQLLERYGGLGAYGRDDQLSNRFLSSEISTLEVGGAIVPSIFLGVAAFLLHNVLTRLVSTQRDQIAILKAFGYTSLTVGMHYLKLVLLVVLVGAVMGTAGGWYFGWWVTRNYTRFFHFPVLEYQAGPWLVAMAIGVSGGAALVGALHAVRRAILLPPAEAMRPEAPPRFKPTFVERLGLGRFLSPAGRMIMRNLERRPVKAFLSVLGIALAVAILVLGRYFVDAVERIAYVQFRNVQREDATVVFTQPRSQRARYEVAHLPGVTRFEPYRAVAARLRFRHYEYRTAITGWEPGGALRRLVDRHLNTVDLPPDGVVLTAQLGEILHVQSGDVLRVETLEGERIAADVRVAAFVDELIGVSAYMDIRALNRLLREGRVISGAYLSVDPLHSERLYTLLKRMPGVTGVTIQGATRQSFEDTVAENLNIFTTVLIVFACVISFGVVYNGARIALSERGWELASLRVLGFTKAEVAVILLGEQAVITLVAVPIGCVLGYCVSAIMPLAYDSELYRLPLVLSKETFAFAGLVVLTAAVLSALVIGRRINRLDLVAVLKTRE